MMRALFAIIAAVLLALAGAAHAEPGRFDCVPGASTTIRALPGGVMASWACITNDGTGYRYTWNRAVATTGFLTDVPGIRKAFASADPLGGLNALLAGRTCAESAAVQALCDEAKKVEDASTSSLPPLWQTRLAPWGGVSVYRLTATGPDLTRPYTVIGRALCDCAAYGVMQPNGTQLCKSTSDGVSYCHPSP